MINDDHEVCRRETGLDDDTIVIDLDRTISMPAPPKYSRPPTSGSRIGDMDMEGPRSVNAEEIDGPSDGSSWFQPQGSSTITPEQRWAGSPTASLPPEVLPLHAESTSLDSGSQSNEVAGAAAFAAMATFFQELARLSSSLVGRLPVSQRWHDAIPTVCAVIFGLICRCVSMRHAGDEAADAADFSPPSEADLGV